MDSKKDILSVHDLRPGKKVVRVMVEDYTVYIFISFPLKSNEIDNKMRELVIASLN